MPEPLVESIAAETGATVATVDVDEHQPLARQFEVQRVPTLLLYVGGERVERLAVPRTRRHVGRSSSNTPEPTRR